MGSGLSTASYGKVPCGKELKEWKGKKKEGKGKGGKGRGGEGRREKGREGRGEGKGEERMGRGGDGRGGEGRRGSRIKQMENLSCDIVLRWCQHPKWCQELTGSFRDVLS